MENENAGLRKQSGILGSALWSAEVEKVSIRSLNLAVGAGNHLWFLWMSHDHSVTVNVNKRVVHLPTVLGADFYDP